MLRTVQLLPQKGLRHWAPTRPVSRPSRQSATGPPDSYPDRTHTGKRRRARTTRSPRYVTRPPPCSAGRTGKLRYAVGDLATLPRAAVVVEDRYSQIFKQDRVRPAAVADGLAELQVRWPTVPIVFAETRPLAQEWTYRYLAAAHDWASTETAITGRVLDTLPETAGAPDAPLPPTAEVRAWARSVGLAVPDRGRDRKSVV